MDAQPGDPAEEIRRLQRCINDLVSLLSLPAIWSGGESSRIMHTLLDALQRMLQLDLVYARLRHSPGHAPGEMVRFSPSQEKRAEPYEIGEIFKRWLDANPLEWPRFMPNPVGGGDLSILPLRLGLQGELGVIVAGSARQDFPRQTEKLISERGLKSGVHRSRRGAARERAKASHRRSRPASRATDCGTRRGQRRTAKGSCRPEAG